MKTQEVIDQDKDDYIRQLEQRITELEKDKERLDKLEKGFKVIDSLNDWIIKIYFCIRGHKPKTLREAIDKLEG